MPTEDWKFMFFAWRAHRGRKLAVRVSKSVRAITYTCGCVEDPEKPDTFKPYMHLRADDLSSFMLLLNEAENRVYNQELPDAR